MADAQRSVRLAAVGDLHCTKTARGTLQPWGEESIKRFVREAVDEAVKLESALASLRTSQGVALLHYSPIQATVEGEPPEIFPFLGSSRLEEPLNRSPVTVVFHGHAHEGKPEGQTRSGVPVYNVAAPVLRCNFPDCPPFRIIDISLLARAMGLLGSMTSGSSMPYRGRYLGYRWRSAQRRK